MLTNALPTSNPDALRTFVSGNEQFQAYLTSGKDIHLEAARKHFTAAVSYDPHFQLAVFYRSLVQSQLRDSDSAIHGFDELLKQGVKFQTEVHIHLGYAHIKRYKDADYKRAEHHFDTARQQAEKAGRNDLRLLTDALTVFLYAVMGGRSSDSSKRPEYLDKALRLGEQLLGGDLRNPGSGERAEARFEVLNGMGIAHMRKGEAAEDLTEKERQWARASDCFDEALGLRPTAVRVMHNKGSLYGMQAIHEQTLGNKAKFEALIDRAKDSFQRSIALNANDQFPHLRLSQLCARTADWNCAWEFLKKGREKNGAVEEQEWTSLEAAIKDRTPPPIHW